MGRSVRGAALGRTFSLDTFLFLSFLFPVDPFQRYL